MGAGFTYMFCGLVVIFAVLFLNLVIARLFGPGRRRNAASNAQTPPPGGGPQAHTGHPITNRHHPHAYWSTTHPSQHRLQLPHSHWSGLEPIPEQFRLANSNDKASTWRQFETFEAVCIKNPDGSTAYATPPKMARSLEDHPDSAFLQPWPSERPLDTRPLPG